MEALIKEQSKRVFYHEHSKEILFRSFETKFTVEILREWFIDDITFKGNNAVIRWVKRHIPLTNDEISRNYGK